MASISDKSASASEIFSRAATLHEMGQWVEARELYQKALRMQPDLPEAHFNLALIDSAHKQWVRAIEHFSQALTHKPDWAAAWYNLAQCYEATGEWSKATPAYRRALICQPNYAEAQYNLGRILLTDGDIEAAETLFRDVIALRPDHAPSYNNLGKCLQAQGKRNEAEQAFKTSCELDPTLAQAWFNLAEIELADDRPKPAIAHYQMAIEHCPQMEAAYNNLGTAYQRVKQFDKAVGFYRHIVGCNPGLAEGHYNLGSALRRMEKHNEAMASLLEAIRLKPDYAEAWNNLALTCKNTGDMDRALTCFNRALQIDPDLAVAHWNRAFVHLLKDDYLPAWADFEWRFRIPQRKSIYPFKLDGRRWIGQPVSHAAILVHDEQGLGDTFQFVRYLPMVRALCRRVILETRSELLDLLQSVEGVDQLVARSTNGRPAAAYDHHVPLMSLPGLFGTTAATVPANVPYIVADIHQAEQWRTRLPASGPKIGLVWSGRPQHTNDRNRSCGLNDLMPLLQIKGIHFVGLQKGPGADQVGGLSGHIDFINLDEQLTDFSATAAVLSLLDLVITVDTAVAHLAGAMGRPVWVMIPYIPDWRWGMHRSDTPWYPTMRLFRQSRPKAWGPVVEAMARQLRHGGEDGPVPFV